MPSILRLENEPKDCFECPLHFHHIGVCAYTRQFTADECPLKPIFTEEDKTTPLSKVDYTKYIVHK